MENEEEEEEAENLRRKSNDVSSPQEVRNARKHRRQNKEKIVLFCTICNWSGR
jgi:hypothetical protein